MPGRPLLVCETFEQFLVARHDCFQSAEECGVASPSRDPFEQRRRHDLIIVTAATDFRGHLRGGGDEGNLVARREGAGGSSHREELASSAT